MLFLVSCLLAAQGNRGLCLTMSILLILMNLNWDLIKYGNHVLLVHNKNPILGYQNKGL